MQEIQIHVVDIHWLGSEGTSLISVIFDKSNTSPLSESEPSDSSSSIPVSIFQDKTRNVKSLSKMKYCLYLLIKVSVLIQNQIHVHTSIEDLKETPLKEEARTK